MPTWTLTVVTKDREYRIPAGSDESVALQSLNEARKYIGRNGTVTIGDRLSLKAEAIISVQISEDAEPFL
jgi:hypothetical protein